MLQIGATASLSLRTNSSDKLLPIHEMMEDEVDDVEDNGVMTFSSKP